MNDIPSAIAGSGLPGMTAGQVLTRVWLLLRSNLRLYLKLAMLPAAGLLLTYAVMFGVLFGTGLFPLHPNTPPDPHNVWIMFPVMLLAVVPMMLLYAIYDAAVCWTALVADRGTSSSFKEAFGKARGRTGRLIWLLFLRWTVAMLPFAGVAVLFLIDFALAPGHINQHPGALFLYIPLTILAYGGSVFGSVWLMLHFGLATPVCLIEEMGGLDALQRSGRLTHNAKGRMFVVLLVIYLCGMAAIIALEIIVMIPVGIGMMIGVFLHLHAFFGILFMIIFGALFASAYLVIISLQLAGYSIALSVLYDDQRYRIEGTIPQLVNGGIA